MLSWIFGGSKGGDGQATSAPSAVHDTVSALSSHADGAATPSSGQFDPTVLERIAKAANELKQNPNASGVLEAVKEQEKTWQQRFQKEHAEAAVAAKEKELENTRVMHEEQRRTIEMQTQHEQHRAKVADQMARQRYEDQLKQQQAQVDRERQLRLQQVAREEDEKRRTIEYQEQLRRETEMLKVKAEGVARAEQERLNKDLRAEQLVLQAGETRKTVIQGIREAGQTIGEGFHNFVTDPQKVAATVGIVTAVAVGVYAAKSGAHVTGQYISNRLARPPLVRETSRTNPMLHPLKTLRNRFRKAGENPLEGIILEKDMKHRLRDVTIATAHTRRHGATYRNLMLYGPPGTGKTMFARRLAQQSGLDFAVLAGGDVGPLGPTAVTEMHRVFDWGDTSKKGLLLFVDEADAFLRKRGEGGDGQMSENLRNALSTFLFRTGSPSTKTMLVLATNEPAAFDRAVLDRVDESVCFKLPGLEERQLLLDKYFNEYVIQGAKGARPIRVDESIPVGNWTSLAKELEGFSGRQINKLCNAWQAAAYASVENALTKMMLETVISHHKEQMRQYQEWEHVNLSSAKI